jgi:hypothetical protein
VQPLLGDAVLQPRLPGGALEDAQAQLRRRAGQGMNNDSGVSQPPTRMRTAGNGRHAASRSLRSGKVRISRPATHARTRTSVQQGNGLPRDTDTTMPDSAQVVGMF